MIEAGIAALKANFPTFTYESAARECYLAMRSKDHSIAVDDVREALTQKIALVLDANYHTAISKALSTAKQIMEVVAEDITAIGSQSIEGER